MHARTARNRKNGLLRQPDGAQVIGSDPGALQPAVDCHDAYKKSGVLRIRPSFVTE